MAFCYIARSVLLFVALQNCVHCVCPDVREEKKLGEVTHGNPESNNNIRCPNLPPRTCKDVETSDPRPVVILADGYEVLCDTETDGGGWIVIQRRMDEKVDFYRKWDDYKYGFGNLTENFWFGNEKIHRLTFLRQYELRVDMTFNGSKYYARYSRFRLFGESENYKLDLDGFSGNTGNNLAYENGAAFSTFDRDNDLYSGNCASVYHGAWWYVGCHDSHLNGVWGSKKYYEGLSWFTLTGSHNSATSSEMKIRPIEWPYYGQSRTD